MKFNSDIIIIKINIIKTRVNFDFRIIFYLKYNNVNKN